MPVSKPDTMRVALFALLLVSLAGCDLFGREDTTISVSGRAVTADGAPIPGLSVTLERSVTLGSVPEARTSTGVDGVFSIEHDPGDTRQRRFLYVNDNPYNDQFSSYREGFQRGERRDIGDINLSLPAAPTP